jgi:hypothetical protein
VNPYQSPYLHPSDQAIGWTLAVFLMILVTRSIQKRFSSIQIRSERYSVSAGYALLLLCVGVAANNIIGYTLLKLDIGTPLLMFSIVLWFMGIIWTFYIFPLFSLCLIGWAFIGKRRAHYTPDAVKLAFTSLLAIVINAILYFVFTLEQPTR